MNELSTSKDEVNNSVEESSLAPAPASAPELSESKLLEEQLVLEHPSYKELLEKLAKAEVLADEYHNKWLLLQAEIENLKRRTEREVSNAHKYALEKFAYEILMVVDNLERSLAVKVVDNETLKDFYLGIELTLKSLLEILQKFGITVINPLNEPFDHEKHTAIATKENSGSEPNLVVEVIQKGYWLRDRLLRPALVVVTK